MEIKLNPSGEVADDAIPVIVNVIVNEMVIVDEPKVIILVINAEIILHVNVYQMAESSEPKVYIVEKILNYPIVYLTKLTFVEIITFQNEDVRSSLAV